MSIEKLKEQVEMKGGIWYLDRQRDAHYGILLSVKDAKAILENAPDKSAAIAETATRLLAAWVANQSAATVRIEGRSMAAHFVELAKEIHA